MDRSSKERDLTAYCGLYCGDCLRYRSKSSELADKLTNELRNAHFGKYAQVKAASMWEFNHYDDFLQVLLAVAKLRCDNPCRRGGDGCAQSCKIKECAQHREFEGCWECDEFEICGKFEFLKPFHGEGPQKNLWRIKEHGVDEWAKHREKFYTWL